MKCDKRVCSSEQSNQIKQGGSKIEIFLTWVGFRALPAAPNRLSRIHILLLFFSPFFFVQPNVNWKLNWVNCCFVFHVLHRWEWIIVWKLIENTTPACMMSATGTWMTKPTEWRLIIFVSIWPSEDKKSVIEENQITISTRFNEMAVIFW